MAATESGDRSRAEPISWRPSESWDGADGDWSSFELRVGNPEQEVRVLPSTAGTAVWVVAPGGCLPNEIGKSASMDCADSRGGLFDASKSTSWSDLGDYSMGLEMNLGYNDSAAYASEAVALGIDDPVGCPQLNNQVVAAYENDDYYIGMFGLSQQPTNLTNLTDPRPSFLTTLRSKNIIPSLSWGYTAGARYQSKGGAFASLTLGGYDSSRFVPNNVSFTLQQDVSRDLVVGLQSITADSVNGSSIELLSNSIYTFIDSTIPYIYLPLDACQAFERTLGLVWNTTYDMYFVDDDLHQSLLNENYNFTFRLGNLKDGGQTVEISLPYSSFDLNLDYPLVPQNMSGGHYFPLMKASNDTQYTLGRTFLQESYLITNYEQSNFSIYQTTFEDGVKPQIVAILSADTQTTPHTGRAIKIGLSFASILFFLLCVLAITIFLKIRRKARKREDQNAHLALRSPSLHPIISSTREIGMNSLIGIYRELPEDEIAELHDIEPPSNSSNETADLNRATTNRTNEDQGLVTHEIMDPHASSPNERFTIRNIQGESNYKIFVSTNLSQQSWASVDLALEAPVVETTISSHNSSVVDIERSLPPTPISESVQTSPVKANFGKRVRRGTTSDATTKRAAIVTSSHGTMEHAVPVSPPFPSSPRRPPLNAWQRSLAHLSYSSMDMEIVIPPGASEIDVVNPLNIRKPTGRRHRRNFF